MHHWNIATIVILLVGLAMTARAELCPNCTGKRFTADVGTCNSCGRMVASGQLALCKGCSEHMGKCEACQKALPKNDRDSQVKQAIARAAALRPVIEDRRTQGKWTSYMEVFNKGSRSARHVGHLQFNGKAIVAQKKGTSIWTPWGLMMYRTGLYTAGWHRTDRREFQSAQPMANPDPAQKAGWQMTLTRRKLLLEKAESVRLILQRPDPQPAYYADLRGPALAQVGQWTKAQPQLQLTLGKHEMKKMIDTLAVTGILAMTPWTPEKGKAEMPRPAALLTVVLPDQKANPAKRLRGQFLLDPPDAVSGQIANPPRRTRILLFALANCLSRQKNVDRWQRFAKSFLAGPDRKEPQSSRSPGAGR